jgi:hypothetical protein
MAATAATASAIAAYLSLLRSRSQGASEALFRVADRMERLRASRERVIYRLDREYFTEWSDEDKELVHALIAELDLVASLIHARQVRLEHYFPVYGDMLLRALYKLGPYIAATRTAKGEQFALPLTRLAPKAILFWTAEAHAGRYPTTVALTGRRPALLYPALFISADASLAGLLATGTGRSQRLRFRVARVWRRNQFMVPE